MSDSRGESHSPSTQTIDQTRLLDDAIARWLQVRAHLRGGNVSVKTLGERLDSLNALDVAAVDASVAGRSRVGYEGVRYSVARERLREAARDEDEHLVKLAEVTESLSLDRIINLHGITTRWLRKQRTNGTVAVARRGDVERRWQETSNWVRGNLPGGRGSEHDLVKRANDRIDAHVLLLSASRSHVELELFRDAVVICVGILT